MGALARLWAWLAALVFGGRRRQPLPPAPDTPDVAAPDGPARVDEDRADDFDARVEEARKNPAAPSSDELVDDINERFS